MRTEHIARIHVGTSGWSYAHWKGRLYPADLPEARWLEFYGARFNTVEINSSFYQLPSRSTLASWTHAVPKRFTFTAKASRYITHMKKLKSPKESARVFLRRIAVLGDNLGPILFQLPPRWKCDTQRLESFLRALSRDFRYAFEFRDRSWINDNTLELLDTHGAAFCIYDLDGYLSPRIVTTDFVYMRLHGPEGPYQGSYDTRTLAGWAGAFSAWARQGREIYCYFDNDQSGYAAVNAARLRDMFGG